MLPFYTTLTYLACWSQGQRKAKPLCFTSCTLFNWSGCEIWYGVEAFQVEQPGVVYVWDLTKRNNCCFNDCINELKRCHAFRHYESILFQLGMIRDNIRIFPCDLDPHWRSHEYKKAMIARYLTQFSIDMDWCGTLLRLVGVMNFMFILSWSFSFQGREPFFYIVLDLFRHLLTKFFQTMLYICIPVWKSLTFTQGHSCMRNEILLSPNSLKLHSWSGWNSVCCHNLMVCGSSWKFILYK